MPPSSRAHVPKTAERAQNALSGIKKSSQHNLSSEMVEELKEAFTLFDADGSGSISAEELHTIMASLGKNVSLEEVMRMIQDVDDDGSGEIEFDEFLVLVTKKMQSCDSLEEMKSAFMVFDRDKR